MPVTQNKIYFITGTQGSGKTSYLIELIKILKGYGIIPGGIVAHGFWEKGQRERFELENILNGDSILYCSDKKQKGWQKIRRFYINPEAEEFGMHALQPDNRDKTDLMVIDEVGPFELLGKGWANAIQNLLQNSELPMIWVVRDQLVDEVIAHFKITNPQLINITQQSAGSLGKIIRDELA